MHFESLLPILYSIHIYIYDLSSIELSSARSTVATEERKPNRSKQTDTTPVVTCYTTPLTTTPLTVPITSLESYNTLSDLRKGRLTRGRYDIYGCSYGGAGVACDQRLGSG